MMRTVISPGVVPADGLAIEGGDLTRGPFWRN